MFRKLEALWDKELRNCFGQARVFERAKTLSFALLRCRDRRTVSNMLVEAGRQFMNWSADYRTFSQAAWDPKSLFDVPKKYALSWIPEDQPIVVAVDDTKLKKSGTKIPGVSYQRDPMSPPFATNFIRAQRFVQLSLSVPLHNDESSPVRGIPVAFKHAPPPPKPSRKATEEEWKEYRKRQREENLSHVGVRMIAELRKDYDELGQQNRKLIITGDGSYSNQNVLKNLPHNTALIGRIRKDAKFFYPPGLQPAVGRKRQYGDPAPTPEQVRLDEAFGWQDVEAFAAGQKRTFRVKTIRNLLWKKAGANLPVRLVVIKPIGYRLTKGGKLFYRQPGYLICTDDQLTLQQIVQWYVWRWDIEVNHRDEKQLIGVGEAQVRSQKAAERLPAFAVASYALLLTASALSYGVDAKAPSTPQPKWRAPTIKKQTRLTTGQLLHQFRQSPLVFGLPGDHSFKHFDAWKQSDTKSPKLLRN